MDSSVFQLYVPVCTHVYAWVFVCVRTRTSRAYARGRKYLLLQVELAFGDRK